MSTGLKAALAVSLGIGAIAVAAAAVTSKRGFSSLLLSALQGIAALFAVNLAGMATGVCLAVNLYSISAAAVLGMPGVIGMLLTNIIFR